MKTRPLFLLAAALPLFASSEASAQSYCTAGALNACASVIVEKNGDQVMIRVRNLQGQSAQDNTWYSAINALQLYFGGVTGFTNFWMATEGSVGLLGPVVPWQASLYGPGWIYLNAGAGSAGIVGCSDGDGAPHNLGNFQTCTQDSWLVFGFTTQGSWNPDVALVRWYADAYGSPDDMKQTLACDPRFGDCAAVGNYVPGSVTPEPVTLALLGTGLAGVGAAARRRRKQQGVDDA